MKTYSYLIIAGLVMLAALNISSIKRSGEPPLAMTGAPGDDGTCADCHSASGSGNGSVDLAFSQQGYQPGDTISFDVSVNDDAASRFGFELTALNNNEAFAGAIVSVTNNSTIRTDNGRQYASHQNANDNNTWTIEWAAPENDAGEVTFYVAGNAADASGDDDGDYIYTNSATLSAITSVAADKPQPSDLKLYPNPAQHFVKFEANEAFFAGNVQCNVYDLQGNMVASQVLTKASNTLDVRHLTAGQYLVELDNGTETITKKLMK